MGFIGIILAVLTAFENDQVTEGFTTSTVGFEPTTIGLEVRRSLLAELRALVRFQEVAG